MAEPRLLRRVLVAADTPVLCALGHRVTASVYTATYQHNDMDGLPLSPFTAYAYDPPTCVVCGLAILTRA